MTGYLVRRLWQSLLVLFGISLIVFILLHLSGDPAVLLMPPDATQEDIDNFRKLMGFNDPLFLQWPPWRIATDTQYGRFFTGVVRGDFGNSFRHQQPAMGLVMERMPATVQLTLTAIAIAVCVAVPVGITLAVGGVRYAILWAVLTFVGEPEAVECAAFDAITGGVIREADLITHRFGLDHVKADALQQHQRDDSHCQQDVKHDRQRLQPAHIHHLSDFSPRPRRSARTRLP